MSLCQLSTSPCSWPELIGTQCLLSLPAWPLSALAACVRADMVKLSKHCRCRVKRSFAPANQRWVSRIVQSAVGAAASLVLAPASQVQDAACTLMSSRACSLCSGHCGSVPKQTCAVQQSLSSSKCGLVCAWPCKLCPPKCILAQAC